MIQIRVYCGIIFVQSSRLEVNSEKKFWKCSINQVMMESSPILLLKQVMILSNNKTYIYDDDAELGRRNRCCLVGPIGAPIIYMIIAAGILE